MIDRITTAKVLIPKYHGHNTLNNHACSIIFAPKS